MDALERSIERYSELISKHVNLYTVGGIMISFKYKENIKDEFG